MDVLLDSRNGLDGGYFSFLGIGEGRKKVGTWRNAQAAELAANNPYFGNTSDQSALILKHEGILEQLKQERSKAKSKKTKNSLDARIQAYNEWLNDAKYHLTQLEKKELTPEPIPSISTLTSGGQTYDISPAPIVTSVGGQVQLPTKQVLVQETPTPIAQDLTLTRTGEVTKEGLVQPTQPSESKRDNTLLYVGIGIAIVGLFIIMKRD